MDFLTVQLLEQNGPWNIKVSVFVYSINLQAITQYTLLVQSVTPFFERRVVTNASGVVISTWYPILVSI